MVARALELTAERAELTALGKQLRADLEGE